MLLITREVLDSTITLAMFPGLANLPIGTGQNTKEKKRRVEQPVNPPVRFRFFLKGKMSNGYMNALKGHMKFSFYDYLNSHDDLRHLFDTVHLSIEMMPKKILSDDYWGTPITEARFALSGEGTNYLYFIDHAESVNDLRGWDKYREFMEEIFSIGPIREGKRPGPVQDNDNSDVLRSYDALDASPDPLGLVDEFDTKDEEEMLQTPSGIRRLYSPSALAAWDNWSINFNAVFDGRGVVEETP